MDYPKLELGNIQHRTINLHPHHVLAAANVLEISVGHHDRIAQNADPWAGKKRKGVSAIAGYHLKRYGLQGRLTTAEAWARVEAAIAAALAYPLEEWVIFNELFSVAKPLVRQLGGTKAALIHGYEYANAIAPNSTLCLRDLFNAPWIETLAGLADPACKRLIQWVEIQVRCDLSWPPKFPVARSRIHPRLGWALKQSRAFEVMRSHHLRELIERIQQLGYGVTLAECTAWVGPNPSQGLINAQGRLYQSWLGLAQQTGSRISWWDWHDGSLTTERRESPDFPGLWTAEGKSKHPEVTATWNLS